MVIYSLHHAPIGKTTQARPFTAAAHIRYITRKSACSRVLGGRMPTQSIEARAWIRRHEKQDRVNARVADKVLLALPRELNGTERATLVREFAEAVTQGKASWLAAFHEAGKDSLNPHVHLVVRDRDPQTGKRVCGMSERGSTERLRELWEKHANLALARAHRPERIDRRTLAAQGIKRIPTIHEGLSAREMESRHHAVRSRSRERRNSPGARTSTRVIEYEKLDQGQSRPAYNRRIRETVQDYWDVLDGERLAREWWDQDRELRKRRTAAAPPLRSFEIDRLLFKARDRE